MVIEFIVKIVNIVKKFWLLRLLLVVDVIKGLL